MIRALALSAVVLASTFACREAVAAGSLRVSPTRLELDAKRPVASLEVSNSASAPVRIQLERMSWTQQGGEDIYRETGDLIATPMIFELAPGQAQIVRVALRHPEVAIAGKVQQAFRLYVREIPRPRDTAGELVLALRIGVPVFAGPEGVHADFEASMSGNADGTASLRLSNIGTAAARIARIEARASTDERLIWKSEAPAYLLANHSRDWTSALMGSLDPGPIDLRIATESGEIRKRIDRLMP